MYLQLQTLALISYTWFLYEHSYMMFKATWYVGCKIILILMDYYSDHISVHNIA